MPLVPFNQIISGNHCCRKTVWLALFLLMHALNVVEIGYLKSPYPGWISQVEAHVRRSLCFLKLKTWLFRFSIHYTQHLWLFHGHFNHHAIHVTTMIVILFSIWNLFFHYSSCQASMFYSTTTCFENWWFGKMWCQMLAVPNGVRPNVPQYSVTNNS